MLGLFVGVSFLFLLCFMLPWSFLDVMEDDGGVGGEQLQVAAVLRRAKEREARLL
jgi:hypothetical protein